MAENNIITRNVTNKNQQMAASGNYEILAIGEEWVLGLFW